MLEMVKQDCFTLETVVERACHAPAKIFDVIDRGHIREGHWADLVVVDPNKKTVVDETELFSKCGWSPFPGERFSHRIDRTIVSGKTAYMDGKINPECRGETVVFSKDRR